jgi:hypothetical protein
MLMFEILVIENSLELGCWDLVILTWLRRSRIF